jgi:hypothetical protein
MNRLPEFTSFPPGGHIVAFQATAVVKCNCQQGEPIMILFVTGATITAKCQHCGTAFQIAGITFDGTKNAQSLNVKLGVTPPLIHPVVPNA